MSVWKFHPVHALSTLSVMFVCGAAYAQAVDIKGRVLERANMQPVEGATVKLTGGSLTAQTGADGKFELKGSVTSLHALPGSAAGAPYLQNGDLFVNAAAGAQPVRVELCGLSGQTLSVSEFRVPAAGWNRLRVDAWPQGDFLGFARITTAGVTHVQRVLRLSGQMRAQFSAEVPRLSDQTRALAKASAGGGKIDVTMDKLTAKSVSYANDSSDLGDIVLDYPARKLDVGATPPYGAVVLFDGSHGKAAAQAEITEKWQDWAPAVDVAEKAKYTAATNTWKIMKDPKYPNDTNHVTVQSCCNTVWGYDDLQAKKVHGDVQLHVEFTCMGEYDTDENTNATDPNTPGGKGYCNSGVYIQSRYEVQIYTVSLDTTAKPNDNHNWMSAIVGDHIPTANPNRKNGEWHAYDITFRTARYGASPEKARISVWWNGKLVHDNVESTAPATGIAPGTHSGEEMNATLYGIKLQSEGRDVRFRNIWMKELTLTDAKTNVGY